MWLYAITSEERFSAKSRFVGSIFISFQVELNNTLIFDCPHYAYKAYLEALLNYGYDQKKSILQAAGYYEDEAPDGKSIEDAGNPGYKARLARLKKGSNDIDIYAPLHIDHFNVDKYLLPHVNVQISLYRSPDSFFLVSPDAAAPNVTVELLSMNLHMRAVDVISSANLALEKTLLAHSAKYAYRKTKLKMLSIPAGRMDFPLQSVFTDTVPRRIVVGCLSQEAVSGNIAKNPYNFVHASISELAIDAAGKVLPAQPLVTDFDRGFYAEAFVQFFENIGSVGENRPLPISYNQYGNGFTLFAFNLTPSDVNPDFELIQNGTCSIRLRFAKPTPAEGLQLIVYAEEDGLLMLDHFRNVFSDNQA